MAMGSLPRQKRSRAFPRGALAGVNEVEWSELSDLGRPTRSYSLGLKPGVQGESVIPAPPIASPPRRRGVSWRQKSTKRDPRLHGDDTGQT